MDFYNVCVYKKVCVYVCNITIMNHSKYLCVYIFFYFSISEYTDLQKLKCLELQQQKVEKKAINYIQK